jgi:hypothetical protein
MAAVMIVMLTGIVFTSATSYDRTGDCRTAAIRSAAAVAEIGQMLTGPARMRHSQPRQRSLFKRVRRTGKTAQDQFEEAVAEYGKACRQGLNNIRSG